MKKNNSLSKPDQSTDLIITKISQQKDKHRVSVYVNNQFAVGLSIAAWIKLGRHKGEAISPSELKKIIYSAWFDKFYQKSLQLLSLRPRTIAEIINSLNQYSKKQKISPDFINPIIDKTIDKLKQQKILNDSDFVSWWVDQRDLLKPTGVKKLKLELRRKGVDQDIIDDYFNREDNWLDHERKMAAPLLIKKIKVIRESNIWKKKKKCLDFLLRRGFSYQVSKELVDQHIEKG